MQPLKFRTGPTSPIEAEAIALLRSVERFQPPLGQKQRVREKILERSTVPRRFPLFRPGLVAGLILVAAGASAAIGGRLIKRAAVTKLTSELPQTRATAASRMKGVLPSDVTSVDISEHALAAPENSGLPVNDKALRLTDHPAHAETSPARSSPSSEKVLVFDAMRALRREGHPEQAIRLLNDYLRRYPQGSLAEEALALSIEASTALGDTKAKSLADRYLALYPSGRFRAAAERARARFTP